MVLSLPFVLALVGAGVGLLVGILIFGEVSDAISCPASGGGGSPPVFNVTSYDNLGTLGTAGLATYAVYEVPSDFEPAVQDGILNEAVLQTGVQSLSTNGEIYLGSSPSTWDFLHKSGVGSDTISINLWLRGDVVGSVNYPILSNFRPTTFFGNGFWFATGGGSFTRFEITENSITKLGDFHSGGTPPDDSQWHMLTITYDKGVTTGNGNLIYCLDASCSALKLTDSSWTGAGGSAMDKLTIGSDADHAWSSDPTIENTFQIDDLAIWNGYTLTGIDISSLWNGGSGAVASSISSANLRGYWSFDDSTANGVSGGGGGGSPEVGSEQCEQAKDTAWTVIGIMPVALFFGLFALFSSFQRPT